jgi:hypothetical protein
MTLKNQFLMTTPVKQGRHGSARTKLMDAILTAPNPSTLSLWELPILLSQSIANSGS